MRRMAAITGLERNEFLLFGDVIGVSQFIETLNYEEPGQPVGYALVGPFLRANAPLPGVLPRNSNLISINICKNYLLIGLTIIIF